LPFPHWSIQCQELPLWEGRAGGVAMLKNVFSQSERMINLEQAHQDTEELKVTDFQQQVYDLCAQVLKVLNN
jgi:hypothetical protein